MSMDNNEKIDMADVTVLIPVRIDSRLMGHFAWCNMS